MDDIKKMIAQAVQHHLITGPERPPLPPRPDDVESVEAHAVSESETSIRIKTHKNGVRYITVKVTANI